MSESSVAPGIYVVDICRNYNGMGGAFELAPGKEVLNLLHWCQENNWQMKIVGVCFFLNHVSLVQWYLNTAAQQKSELLALSKKNSKA